MTARRSAEVSGDPTYKRLSRTQKGKIMGWCRAETWDTVPKFLHGVEATKSEDNMRTMLDRLLRAKIGDMDNTIYKVYWTDAMVKAIRTAKITAGDEDRYTTWETTVTGQQFMPRTTDRITYLEHLRERKEMARGNRTMDDLEKEKKGEVMRIPPMTMEEAQKGLCTYLHFLSMAGVQKQRTLQGRHGDQESAERALH